MRAEDGGICYLGDEEQRGEGVDWVKIIRRPSNQVAGSWELARASVGECRGVGVQGTMVLMV
jgi:hypothetical protein